MYERVVERTESTKPISDVLNFYKIYIAVDIFMPYAEMNRLLNAILSFR